MKRNLRLCLLALLLSTPFCLMAQSPARYGFLNRAAVIAILPETARVRAHLDSLRSKYEAEARYNETAFRRQYSEYLQVQKNLPEAILLKRQGDLQMSMERGLAFRREAENLLKKAETELMGRVGEQVDAVIRAIGAERGYDFVVDTSAGTQQYLNPEKSEDITPFVKARLLNVQ